MNVRENDFFRQATIRICSNLDIDTALKRCFDYIREFIPATSMDLFIEDHALKVIIIVASVDNHGRKMSKRLLPLPEESRDEREDKLPERGRIQIINRNELMPEAIKLRDKIGLHPDVSHMLLRLDLEGNRICRVGVHAEGIDQFTHEHVRFLEILHEPFAIAMSNALQHKEIVRLKEILVEKHHSLPSQPRELLGDEIIGSDFGLKAVMEKVYQVAPQDSPVLLLGETGVGKEVIANAIHRYSHRKNHPFIKVNCGAIPETLVDSELFGSEKGAFTGAFTRKLGRFERAHKGTIFLDEIGELPMHAQARLLNVLQNKEIERVGGTEFIPLDIRIISATHRDLYKLIASGRFREDLWFRLHIFPIRIPPLRNRKEDIPALVHHFIERKSMELKLKDRPVLTPAAVNRLISYDWPGNVRELINVIERALIQHGDGVLTFESLLAPPVFENSETATETAQNRPFISLDDMNAHHIQRALEMSGGKINGPGGAAELLKVHPNTLRKRMQRLGIPYGRKSWRPVNPEV